MTGHNPEGSRLVGVYRNALPPSARSALANSIPAGVRSRVKRAVAEVPKPRNFAGTRARRLLRNWPELAGRTDGVPRATVFGNLVVLVHRRPRPVDLREHVLRLVTDALTDAGVRYFALRAPSDLRTCIAVPDGERAAAERALRALGTRTPCYAAATDRAGELAGELREMSEEGTWKRLRGTRTVRVAQLWTDPGAKLLMGFTYGCEIEFWAAAKGLLTAPRPNRAAVAVPEHGREEQVPTNRLGQFADPYPPAPATVRTRPEFTARHPEDVDFPIDVVYTWVDGADPAWQARRAAVGGDAYHQQAANAARYLNRDELRYSLRSLHLHAPWVRRIHLVTDGQRPHWLDEDHPRLRVVDHREVFADPANLPTFNSHAIESQLHRIEGLAEHFLYFNDDMFIGRAALPQQFFLANGTTRFFPSDALIPPGPPTPADAPVNAAGKNNRELVRSRFGTVITQKMLHVPYPLRRSLLAEIAEEFAPQVRATAANRFRSIGDVAVPSSLYHYFAYHTARATPGDLAYTYLDLGLPNVERRMGILLAGRDRDAFCLNDTVTEPGAARDRAVRDFLESYFPVPSPYEKPGATP
ncbi:stealth family protein [Kitasatospora phosalacinea]|uniref:stealth family protein n=1 Tax=Kitasatospora phosalacinea TaxID=2065 RepID=UPI0035DEC067